jgi:SAM-dependent methyltransferase/CelD/BcsL family acetyltransferase involved in cellulose biosynthesis
MNVKFLDDFEVAGQKAWDALVAKSPTNTVFQTWAWQRAWWRSHACSGRKLCLAAVYDGNDLRVLMPLFCEDRVLRFIGHGAADRIDLIYDAARSADLLALLMPLKAKNDWDEIELSPVPDASPTWRYLKIMAEEAGLFPLSMYKYPLRGLRLEGREDRLRRFLHTGVLVKHASIFMSKGRVSTSHERSPRAASLPWKKFFVQHIYRWLGRVQSGLFAARQERDFFRHLAEDQVLNAAMVFTVLELNDKPAGYYLGFIYGQVFYAYISSFDVVLRRFSPDDVLWREMTAYALAQKCREIVFVSAEEAAVRHFSDRTGTARALRVFRSRRAKWSAKFSRWAGKVPMAQGVQVLLAALVQVFVVFFNRKKIVEGIRQRKELPQSCCGPFPITRPEIELLRRLRPELKDTRMLDIGIGRGRTTVYFAPVVKKYHGFDHAQAIVVAAKASLDDQLDPEDIFLADARNMSFAADGAYDLVLFSGEGIDEVSVDDRARILKEVHRVGREGAWFCFSSRNLQSLKPGVGGRVMDLLRRLCRRMLMAAANPGLARLRCQSSAVLFDETGDYKLPVYYLTPKEQVRILKELGFHDVRVLSTRTGLEVRDWRRWDKLIDDTLYYLCRV